MAVNTLNFYGVAHLAIKLVIAVHVLNKVAVYAVHAFFKVNIHLMHGHAVAIVLNRRFSGGKFSRWQHAAIKLFYFFRIARGGLKFRAGHVLNNAAAVIKQVAFAIFLENSFENPTVAVIVGKLGVLQ